MEFAICAIFRSFEESIRHSRSLPHGWGPERLSHANLPWGNVTCAENETEGLKSLRLSITQKHIFPFHTFIFNFALFANSYIQANEPTRLDIFLD